MSLFQTGLSAPTMLAILVALVATAIFFYHLGFLRCYEADTKEEASRMDWECPECGTHAPIYCADDLINAWRVHDDQAECVLRWSATL